jgi:t-SNARE complex subunit (syntaxin)
MIAQFNGNVSRISELQSRALNVVGGTGEQSTALLDDQITQTRELSSQIKKRIEILKRQGIRRGQESRKDQVR